MVASVLAGRPPTPVVRAGTAQRLRGVRRDGAAAPAPSDVGAVAPAPRLIGRRFEVTDVEAVSPDAVSAWLVPVSGDTIPHTAGQFLTLAVPYRGEELRRAYSISSAPGDARGYRIAVKRVRDGVVSNHLNDTLAVGDRLDVFGPSGSFTFVPTDVASPLVLIAGGSGITPILSIVHAALAAAGGPVTLIVGNRCPADVMYRAELAATASRGGERLRLIHTYDDAGDRLDQDGLERTLSANDVALDAPGTQVYVCGPEPMMAAARNVLHARGVPAEAIHEERFASPADPGSGLADLQDQEVALGPGGPTFVVRAGQTILAAAQGAGVDLPFSCAMGGCGACSVTLSEGEVMLPQPHCLTPLEQEAGVVLTCIARPLSSCQLEVP